MQGQCVRGLDDRVIQAIDLRRRVERVHRRHDPVRQSVTRLVDQVHGHRALAQQVTIERCDEHPFEQRFEGDILDQQIRLEIFDRSQNIQQRMGGEHHLDRCVQPHLVEPFDFIGGPTTVAAQIALIACVVDFVFPHMHHRRRLDKGPHRQFGPARPGQRDGPQHGGGLMQGLVGDQQQTLILAHHTPRLDTGHQTPASVQDCAPRPLLPLDLHQT